MARKPNLVKFEGGIHWLTIKLAAEKSGLTKPELTRRALAGDLRFLPDSYGMPEWFAEPDIDPLRKAFLEKEIVRKEKSPRKKSLKQLEREWAAGPKHNEMPMQRIGPVALHLEKVMLREIEAKRKKGD
jgi:hypothetical protein